MKLVFAALAAGLLGAGCTCSPLGVEQRRFACATTADCAGGFVCNRGECRSEQPEGSACLGVAPLPCGAPGSTCAQQCVGGKLSSCLPPTGNPDLRQDPHNCGECGRRCGGSLACVQGVCSCLTHSDCLADERCSVNGICVAQSDPCVGVACPPATACRGGSCVSVACVGVACPPGEHCVADQCEAIGSCHLPVSCAQGTCEGPPRPDGTLCDDRQDCTRDDSCLSGVCTGAAYNCAATTACQKATCAGDGTCVYSSLTDGTTCLSCQGVDSCTSGKCGAGFSCPAPTQCQTSVACLADGGCAAVNRGDGAPCDDGAACTTSDVCQSGACSGTTYSCAPPGPCESTVVCAGDGGCTRTLKANGAACAGCASMMGTCTDGACSVGNGTCPAPTSCQQSVSCLGDGGCLPVPKPDGTGCNDNDACTSPDTCTGGICSGPPGSMVTWYRDADGDGTGAAAPTMLACLQPSGYVATTGDCDDGDPDVYRTVTSLVTDADHDGYGVGAPASQCVGASTSVSGRTYYQNSAGTFTWLASGSSLGTDCDDANAAVLGQTVWYLDADLDGYGGPTSVLACSQPANTVATSTDCNDANANVYQTVASLVVDADQDGYAGPGSPGAQCVGPSTTVNGRPYWRGATGTYGWLPSVQAFGLDCYDSNASAYPGQAAYFLTNRGDGSFDYNCSGTAEMRLTNSLVGTVYSPTVSTIPMIGCTTARPGGVSGWIGSAPACGTWGDFRHCHSYSDTFCNFVTSNPYTFGAACTAGGSWFSSEHYMAAQVVCH